MSKMKLYATAAAIDAACVAFEKKGVTLQTEAHKIACSVLAHLGEHSDIRVVTRFLAALPDMARSNAVRTWFETFGPVEFESTKPMFTKARKVRLGEAMDTPFWKLTVEAAYVPLNASKALESLIKKLQKDAKETGRDHTATIAALKTVPVSAPVAVTVQ